MITLLDHQKPPDVDWHVWMMVGGCGTGLSTALRAYILAHLHEHGKRAVVGLMTPKLYDLQDQFTGLSGEFQQDSTTLNHEQGGVLYGFSEATVAWAKAKHFTLLAIDRLNHISEAAFTRARAEIRLKVPTFGQKGTNIAGRIAIATQPLTEQQVRDAGHDWIRGIADEEWTVVTRPDMPQLAGVWQSIQQCPDCMEHVGDLIQHDIAQHDGMSRVLAHHTFACQADGCVKTCRFYEYDAVYKLMKG